MKYLFLLGAVSAINTNRGTWYKEHTDTTEAA